MTTIRRKFRALQRRTKIAIVSACAVLLLGAGLVAAPVHKKIFGNLLVAGRITSNAGVYSTGDQSLTLGASEKVLIDGSTTAQTQTAGALDVNLSSITDEVNAVNISATMANGMTAGQDLYGQKIALTCNDADGDMFGLYIQSAATANAAAGSYEALLWLDNAENTAAAVTDAILVSNSGGTGTAITDGLDVSSADIVYGVNTGVNPILGGNGESLSIGATDDIFLFSREDAGIVTLTCADSDAVAGCTYDAGGAAPIVVGSADVTIITLQTDDTGDGTDLVLPAQGVNASEVLNDTLTFAQVSDSSAIDADTAFTAADGISLTLTPSHTSGDWNFFVIDANQVDDLIDTDDFDAFRLDLTSESDDAGDTFDGLVITWENGTANTIIDSAVKIDNAETTAATMTDAIIVTSSGVALGVTDGIDVSDANILYSVNAGVNPLLGGNGESFSIGASDDVFLFSREDAGVVTLTCADNDATAGCVYDAGGASPIVVGSADVTAITLQTDDTGDGTDLVLPAQGVNAAEVLNDTLTFAQISDSSAIDADTAFTAADGISLTLTPSHTSGDWNFFTIDANQVDDAAATDDFDAFRLDLTSESDDAADTFDGIVINWENGTANTIIDSAIKIDNAETTAATMTDAIIVTSSGVALGVTDGLDVSAANILNAVNIGINPILGGNGESFSVGASDDVILFSREDAGVVTLTCADNDATAGCVYDAGGASPIVVGSADVTAITLQTDDTGDGTDVVLPAGSVDAAEILDLTRSVGIPLGSAIGCGSGDDMPNFDDAADTYPDFSRGSAGSTQGSLVLEWDVTGGSLDVEEVCFQIVVPSDYVSGGAFYVTLLDTATNDHVYNAQTIVQAADAAEDVSEAAPSASLGVGASTTTTTCDGATTPSDLYSCIFTAEALAAGNIVTFEFGQLTGTNALSLFGVEFRYTATQ